MMVRKEEKSDKLFTEKLKNYLQLILTPKILFFGFWIVCFLIGIKKIFSMVWPRALWPYRNKAEFLGTENFDARHYQSTEVPV